MSDQYEIEIKSLLGSTEKALKLKERIQQKGGVFSKGNKQLNHYFIINDLNKFKDKLKTYIPVSNQPAFERILAEGNNFSIRTRDIDGKVILVIKASIGSDSSSNGVSRLEFESEMKMNLDELDRLLLDSGLEYQAKWSREREEYKINDINVCIDKNAGYGYLAEFEKVVQDRSVADVVKKELLETMKEFGVEELPQARLERMFTYYNSNWRDYYGTEKIFNIE